MTCFQLAYDGSEWIKGLLAVPFVLHSEPTGVFESRTGTVAQMAEVAHRRYAEIMQDVEDMIDDHSKPFIRPSRRNLTLFSCTSEGWSSRPIQAQITGSKYWNVLYTTSSCRCIQIPR
jgi:hypothetical protein